MRLIDLSHPLANGMPGYPGDPQLAVSACARIATHSCNVSRVVLSTHTGTHLDAMSHVFDEGRTLDQMPLGWFHGPARMLRLPKEANTEITAADLEPHAVHLRAGARIILNTGWYRQFGTPRFFAEHPSLTLEAAHYLASKKIRLLGLDLPSPARDWIEPHRILLAKDVEIVLVESLANLDALPEEFTFIGFPLNFQGRDGSPIRAVALCP